MYLRSFCAFCKWRSMGPSEKREHQWFCMVEILGTYMILCFFSLSAIVYSTSPGLWVGSSCSWESTESISPFTWWACIVEFLTPEKWLLKENQELQSSQPELCSVRNFLLMPWCGRSEVYFLPVFHREKRRGLISCTWITFAEDATLTLQWPSPLQGQPSSKLKWRPYYTSCWRLGKIFILLPSGISFSFFCRFFHSSSEIYSWSLMLSTCFCFPFFSRH